ncbi:hypothetical protein LINPERPRIM_LOCUS23662, partial [Linum perenne]
MSRRRMWIGNARRRLVDVPCLMMWRGYIHLEFWWRLGLLLLSIIFFLRLGLRLEWRICCYMGTEVQLQVVFHRQLSSNGPNNPSWKVWAIFMANAEGDEELTYEVTPQELARWRLPLGPLAEDASEHPAGVERVALSDGSKKHELLLEDVVIVVVLVGDAEMSSKLIVG